MNIVKTGSREGNFFHAFKHPNQNAPARNLYDYFSEQLAERMASIQGCSGYQRRTALAIFNALTSKIAGKLFK